MENEKQMEQKQTEKKDEIMDDIIVVEQQPEKKEKKEEKEKNVIFTLTITYNQNARKSSIFTYTYPSTVKILFEMDNFTAEKIKFHLSFAIAGQANEEKEFTLNAGERVEQFMYKGSGTLKAIHNYYMNDSQFMETIRTEIITIDPVEIFLSDDESEAVDDKKEKMEGDEVEMADIEDDANIGENHVEDGDMEDDDEDEPDLEQIDHEEIIQ